MADPKKGASPKHQTPEERRRANPNANPKIIPMGGGRVGQARNAIAGRGRQIDDAVEAAERGTLSGARRPRSY